MSDENYYKVGGSLEYQHPTYVVRQADFDLYQGLTNGEFCYVLNSRQMGKSSLRVQMMKKLKEQGFKCASIDMTRIGSHVTPAEWYAGIVSELLRGFSLTRKVNFSSWWRDREALPPLQRLTELIEDVLLAKFSQNLVIFIDEIDSIIKINFKEDFFAFIRACYNQRVDNPEYNRLTFCLLGVATPSDLIGDKNISTPFNIGRAIELTGFQLHEVQPLIQGLEGRVSDPSFVMREILEWTGGQPFLTQKLCRLVIQESGVRSQESGERLENTKSYILKGRKNEYVETLVRSRLIENWETQDEPEHLRTIRDRILWSQRKGQLLQLYQQILQTGEVKANDKPEQMELRLSGLVVKQQGKLRVYNRIYASVFNQSWVKNALAEAGLLPKVAETPTPQAEIQALEQAVSKALRQLESQQIETLLLAIQAGQALKALITDGCPLQDYPTISPLSALQTILDNIRERNQFNSYLSKVYIHDVRFSPDGEKIVTAEDDGTIQLWKQSGQPLLRWKAHWGAVRSVSFSPNGDYLVTAGRDGKARLWNLLGQQITEFDNHQGWGLSVCFSPNGQQLVTVGGGHKARLWNLFGQQIAEFDGHRSSIWSVSFSPDGQQLATAGMDGKIRLWNLSGQQIAQFEPHQGEAWSVSFSPDGQQLATAGNDNIARLWNLSGQLLVQLNGHQGMVRSVSFSPDGQQLATAGYDGTVRIWNLLGQQLAQLNGHCAPVLSVCYSPDGQYLTTAGSDGTARLWDLSENHLPQLKGHQGSVWSVNFSPDGQLIATTGRDGTARLWNLSGQQLAQLDSHQGSVWSVSFSSDGRYILTTGSDKTARLWNLSGQQLAKLDGHHGWVTRVIFSPDGQRLATVGRDGTARLWDLSGQLISQVSPHQGWVWSVSFSPDGQLLATVGLDARPPILDLSGRFIIQLKDYRDAIASTSFSPDGRYLVTASSEDGTARLWNVFGQQLAQLDGNQGWVISVSFNPDGQLVATAGEDGSVCLWDLSGRQIFRFESNQGTIYGMSFSPNGQCLATAGKDGTVRLWRVEGLDELLARGCNWLKDYLVTHPEALEKLKVCQNKCNPLEASSNLVRAGDAEEAISDRAATLKEQFTLLSQQDEVKAIAKSLSSTPVVCNNLNSERGIDYTRLHSRLAAGRWKAADQETTEIMLRIAGREAEGWLREEDIENFPCTDLLTIDQIWVKYSKGRFGFSVQKQIWESVGGTNKGNGSVYDSFCRRVGWLKGSGSWLHYCDLIFETIAPAGHLPGGLLDWLWWGFRNRDGFVWWNIIPAIASRLSESAEANRNLAEVGEVEGVVSANFQRSAQISNDIEGDRAKPQTVSESSSVPRAVARQRLVTAVFQEPGEGFLGEFFVREKLVRIYQGDITNLAVDVIVSSDDSYLAMGGGVSYSIREVGGDEIYREASNLIPLSLGEVAITTAGQLQAKKIFHAVVIDFYDREGPSEDVIQRVVHACMKKASGYRFGSIAFPLLGTGSGGFPVKVAWEITLRQIIRDLTYENQNIVEVILVLHRRQIAEDLNIKAVLEKIKKSGWRVLL